MSFYDFGSANLFDPIAESENNFDYIASEIMENGDLFQYVSNNGFNESCARYIFRKVVNGIDHIHSHGYAHLDIKLSNILLDSNFDPKLTDFGFCSRLNPDGKLDALENQGTKNYQ